MKNYFLFTLFFCLSISNLCFANDSEKQRSDRKIIEIKKIIEITSKQEQAIRKAYDVYNEKTDYALYKIDDSYIASKVKYEANKDFHKKLMELLSDQQRNTYIRVTATPEIELKTQYKLELLIEAGEYTDEEILSKKQEIFEYLMAEKLVYTRDKHDYRKQKDNIGRLKRIEPKSLRESNIREKLTSQGKTKRGKINW